MKWCIDQNNRLSKEHFQKIKQSITKGKFSNITIQTILENKNSDFEIELSSDNKKYIEHLVDRFISKCYANNFIFNIAINNQKMIYNRINKNNKKWQFSINKVTYEDSLCLSYYINISNSGKNYCIILNYDNTI